MHVSWALPRSLSLWRKWHHRPVQLYNEGHLYQHIMLSSFHFYSCWIFDHLSFNGYSFRSWGSHQQSCWRKLPREITTLVRKTLKNCSSTCDTILVPCMILSAWHVNLTSLSRFRGHPIERYRHHTRQHHSIHRNEIRESLFPEFHFTLSWVSALH